MAVQRGHHGAIQAVVLHQVEAHVIANHHQTGQRHVDGPRCTVQLAIHLNAEILNASDVITRIKEHFKQGEMSGGNKI